MAESQKSDRNEKDKSIEPHLHLFGVQNVSGFSVFSVVVSSMFDFHPYFGKIPNLTNTFQMGWFNHQPVLYCLHRTF